MENSVRETNVYYLDERYHHNADGTCLRRPRMAGPARFNDVVVENTAGHAQDR
jgi:hypothetical protein